ncbi:hypothetical protein CEP53_012974 [Fusarium sp. AF-6]|nr:hypothetical protein CEP53_012974 [Fusarium sp. AF-6]
MQILQRHETFKRIDNRNQFHRVKFTIEQDGNYYIGYLKARRETPSDLSQLQDVQQVQTTGRGPKLQPHWTITLPTNESHVKKPAIDDFANPKLESQIEHEIQVWEIIKQHPHPALAVYHGCVESEGRVSGLVFERYEETLSQRVNPGRLCKRNFIASGRPLVQSWMRRWLKSIESALVHLHSLGLVHNDITPANIMLSDKNEAVIIDCDSACRVGESLVDKKRTCGWADRDVTHAAPSNDLKSLDELETWLFGSANELAWEGKTQIALHHVYSLKETHPDTSIFWVQANNIEQLYESYASIAQRCNIPGSSDIGSNPLDLVPWWLENKAKSPWLMVVDSADNMESFFQTDQGKRMAGLTDADDVRRDDIAAYMPKCSHGAILFTTTNPRSKLFVGASIIPVDGLNKNEANQMIRNSLHYSDPHEDVDDLSWWLSNFPSAITLATSFIRTNSISIKEYIELLDGARFSLVNLRDSPGAPDLTRGLGRPLEVMVPCLVLLQQLEREDKRTNDLVQFSSLFHHQGIQQVFLSQYQTAESLDPSSLDASLTKLKMNSALLERNDGRLEMHRLLQLLIQKLHLQKGGIPRAAEKAMSVFWWSYPYGQPITHSTLATYLLNAFSIFRCSGTFSLEPSPQKLAVIQTLMVYFESRGRWKDLAMRYAQDVVKSVERLGEEHLETLDLMSKLSFVYMHQHRWEDAERLQSYLRKTKCMILGDNDISTVMSRECHIFIDLKKRSQDTPPLLRVEALTGKERAASPMMEVQQPWTGFPWSALKNDILASREKNVPQPNLPQLVDSIWNRIPIFGPPVAEGQARVRWTCPCGQQLFDDFSSSSPESLQALLQNLQNHNLSSGQGQHTGSSSSQDSTSRPNLKWPWPTFMPGNNFNEFLRRKKEEGTALPMHTLPRIPEPVANTTPYLLMCIDRGRHFTGLYQHVLQNVEDDTQLFQFLRDNVSRHRGISSWLTFRSVNAISLTRFEADNSQYAEVHRHKEVCGKDCICIPPPERVQNDEYDCSPSPTVKPTQVPVIGTNRLTHYFLKPHAFHGPQRTILNQLPKRARGPLSTTQDSMQLGWGIHIQEGWHWRSIYFVIVVVFLIGGLAFGIAWSIKEKDIQSAFAISATWIAISPLLFGWIAVRDLQ